MRARGVVGTVVVLGLLVAGAVVADGMVRDRTQDRLADEVQAQIAGLEERPDVTIAGFPFLTQVLGGELDDVQVTAPAATVEGLRLEEIDVRLAGVTTDRPTTVRDARMTALLTLDAVEAVLDVPADLSIEGGSLFTSTEVMGLPVDVVLVPRAAGRAIEVDVESIRVAGASVSVDDLPGAVTEQLQGLSFPVDSLPPGLELTGLTVEPAGLRIQAAGTDVILAVPQP